MNKSIYSTYLMLFLILASQILLNAQVYEFTSQTDNTILQHRIFKDSNYFIETVFVVNPPQFKFTRGGFYTESANRIEVIFEFNSNIESDGLKKQTYSQDTNWEMVSKEKLPLEGKWLMGGRVTDTGEQRRDLSRSRKTMKMLFKGYFQWTAFNTETFAFFGSGGGRYSAGEEKYEETIEYFSRDNSRVGQKLSFSYDQKGKDWYHNGLSSKGKPLHEIWTSRD